MEELAGMILQAVADGARKKVAARTGTTPPAPAVPVAAPSVAAGLSHAQTAAIAKAKMPASRVRATTAQPAAQAAHSNLDELVPVRARIVADFSSPRSLVAAIVVAEALDLPLALRRRD